MEQLPIAYRVESCLSAEFFGFSGILWEYVIYQVPYNGCHQIGFGNINLQDIFIIPTRRGKCFLNQGPMMSCFFRANQFRQNVCSIISCPGNMGDDKLVEMGS